MYLKKIVCENMRPISYVDIEPGFTEEGNPKPLILVGKNGTGKSILISNIADSLFEFGDQPFSDVTAAIEKGGHSFFLVSAGNQIKSGQSGMFCYLQYADEVKQKYPEYIFHTGEIDIEAIRQKTSCQISVYNSKEVKNVSKEKNYFKDLFRDNSIAYFPPERYSMPYWACDSYSFSPHYGDFDLTERLEQILNKPIRIENAIEENTKWLMDVAIDAMAQIDYFFCNTPCVNPDSNLIFFNEALHNVEKILSMIMEDSIKIKLNWRHSGKSRISLFSTKQQMVIAPTLDALSTGQMMLLNLFMTIMRYSDSMNLKKSVSLQEICGIAVIDEIEMHLHSDLQRKILPRLIKLFPKVQFIITSHSPLFLLGMQELFEDDGFDIYEMPNGEHIEAESFSEFGKAYEIFVQTKIYQHDIDDAIKKQITDTKALIITEGASDWKHMLRAWQKIKNQQEYAELVD